MSLAKSVEQHLDDYFQLCSEPQGEGLYNIIMREVERPLLQKALHITQGNKSKAAEILGLHRNTFKKKMVELGLD